MFVIQISHGRSIRQLSTEPHGPQLQNLPGPVVWLNVHQSDDGASSQREKQLCEMHVSAKC